MRSHETMLTGDLLSLLMPKNAEALRLNSFKNYFGLEVFQLPQSGKLVVSGYASADITRLCQLRNGSIPLQSSNRSFNPSKFDSGGSQGGYHQLDSCGEKSLF